jgi:hypothetical protein
MRRILAAPHFPAFVLVCLAVTSVGCGGSASEGEEVAPPSRALSSITTAGWKELQAAFAVFRSPPESLPVSIRGQLGVQGARLDLNHAQHLRGDGKGRYWLVPTGEEVCLFEVRGGAGGVVDTCTPRSMALLHGCAIVSIRPLGKNGAGPYKRRVFGVVPDWVKRVSVHTGSERARPAVHQETFNLSDWNFNPPDSIETWPRPLLVSH